MLFEIEHIITSYLELYEIPYFCNKKIVANRMHKYFSNINYNEIYDDINEFFYIIIESIIEDLEYKKIEKYYYLKKEILYCTKSLLLRNQIRKRKLLCFI